MFFFKNKAAISASLHAVAIAAKIQTPNVLSKRVLIKQDASYAILGLVQDEPDISIAEISRQLGVSNGMAHYVLRSLIDKGSMKVLNLL